MGLSQSAGQRGVSSLTINATVYYSYDAFNRRTTRSIAPSTGLGTITYRELYLYDGDNVVMD